MIITPLLIVSKLIMAKVVVYRIVDVDLFAKLGLNEAQL